MEFTKYDMMRFELFEIWLPTLIYKGTEKQQEDMISYLKNDGTQLIHELFASMCQQDGVPYPYSVVDFSVKHFLCGGIEYIEIDLPAFNPKIHDFKRAYLLMIKDENGKWIKKYYTIRRFVGESQYIMYVDAKGNVAINEEIDDQYIDDMDHEYWRLANCFFWGYVRDMKEESKKKKRQQRKKRKDIS